MLAKMNRNLNYQESLEFKFLFLFLLFYIFSLSYLIVTPYYYIINYISIAFAVFSLIFIPQLRTLKKSVFLSFYFLQLIWLFFGLFFTEHPTEAFIGFISLLKNVITALIPALFITNQKKLKFVLFALILGGLVNLLNYVPEGFKTLSTGVRYLKEDELLALNSFSHGVLIYAFSAILLISIMKKGYLKWFIYFYLGLCLIAILLSGSRQVIVAFLSFMIIYRLLKIRPFNLKKVVSLVFFVCLLLLFGYLVYYFYPHSSLVNRFVEGGNAGDEDRLLLFHKVIDLLSDSPLIGHGINTFQYYSKYDYTHSTYLELLFTGGLIYFILYLSFYFLVFKKIYKKIYLEQNNEFKLMFAIIFGILANGAFFLIHQSRLALTITFIIMNYVLIFRTNSKVNENGYS